MSNRLFEVNVLRMEALHNLVRDGAVIVCGNVQQRSLVEHHRAQGTSAALLARLKKESVQVEDHRLRARGLSSAARGLSSAGCE